ncbi:MAG: hypothetical protein JRC86_11780 [Deltaproteobacteria bacterium]|nr:hypothetical protein [Deltaproteobacteria bacterium]
MIRFTAIPILALALLPLALLFLALGIYAISTEKKNGIWLKLALLVNSSLILALGAIGCGGEKSNAADGASDDGETVMCYMMPASDVTVIPQSFEASNDWVQFENSLSNLEYYITTEDFNEDVADEFYGQMGKSITNLKKSGLITDDDATILRAYCASRYDYYIHMIGGATCYEPMPIPAGKEATKEDIVAAANELHQLYAEYKIDTPAYDKALANLDNQLEIYTGKEDNAVLRQLLLDLADAMSGEYWTD